MPSTVKQALPDGVSLAKVAERNGMTAPTGPDGAPMDVVDVHRVVRGR